MEIKHIRKEKTQKNTENRKEGIENR